MNSQANTEEAATGDTWVENVHLDCSCTRNMFLFMIVAEPDP